MEINIPILTSVGFIISTLLGMNAYFIKGLVSEITGMRVDLAKVTTQHDNTVSDVKDNKARIFELEKEKNSIRERLHALEGATSQFLAHINDKGY